MFEGVPGACTVCSECPYRLLCIARPDVPVCCACGEVNGAVESECLWTLHQPEPHKVRSIVCSHLWIDFQEIFFRIMTVHRDLRIPRVPYWSLLQKFLQESADGYTLHVGPQSFYDRADRDQWRGTKIAGHNVRLCDDCWYAELEEVILSGRAEALVAGRVKDGEHECEAPSPTPEACKRWKRLMWLAGLLVLLNVIHGSIQCWLR